MERVRTGIRGFDELIEGGIPAGSVVLLSGTPGTGKTIFGLEYLHRGALAQERGVYITFEEKESNLHRQAATFGWDLKKGKKIRIVPIPVNTVQAGTPGDLVDVIHASKARRVVIDSLSTLTMNTPTLTDYPHTLDTITVKRFIYNFIEKIGRTGATILLVSHSHTDSMLSVDGVSEFICDGIIKIHSQTLGGDFSRALKVEKMRSTKNDDDIHPLEISSSGLVIHSLH